MLGVVICAMTLLATGGGEVRPLPGLPAGSAVVRWLIPAVRLLADGMAVLTVGCLFAAAVLLPGRPTVTPAGYRWLRTSGWAALLWAGAALLALPLLLADFLGTDLAGVSMRGLVGFVLSVAQGRAQLLVAVLSGTIAVTARTVLTPTGARLLCVLALPATLPPAFTGHAADQGGHTLAVTAVGLHVAGLTTWSGGLVALFLARNLRTPERHPAAQRFSHWALPLVAVVALSGILTAVTRLSAPGQLLDSGYGRILLLKGAALVGLATVGWWHRRQSLPALAAGRPAAFLQLAAAEIVLFVATIGLAVGLSRTPPPPDAGSSAVGVWQLGTLK